MAYMTLYIHIQLTLNNAGVMGANLPCSQKSDYNFITVFMGSINCRMCSTLVLFLEKESVYKQIHVDQSFTAEGTLYHRIKTVAYGCF